ncbi:MAG: hypothetical protein LBO75_02705 [Bifidobacteriaceae bacterium]|jgi:ElaB/YqjD/DUF883 family membrane-anchored ribosome-binding protein|nr:hypothetical protein [Bifidobacteriaceae bacterium]
MSLPPAPPVREPDPPRSGKDEARERAQKDREQKRAELEKELKALTAEQRAELARVNRHVLGFGAAAMAAMVALILPLPWPALGIAALIGAVIVALRGIVLARRIPLARGAIMYLSLGLSLLGVFMLYSVPLLFTWEDQWNYQQCVEQTQTIQGQDTCLDTLEKATKNNWQRLLQG